MGVRGHEAQVRASHIPLAAPSGMFLDAQDVWGSEVRFGCAVPLTYNLATATRGSATSVAALPHLLTLSPNTTT
jgi:hypothetical protein